MEGIKKKIAQLRTELDAEKEKTEEVERQKKEAISRAETVSVSALSPTTIKRGSRPCPNRPRRT